MGQKEIQRNNCLWSFFSFWNTHRLFLWRKNSKNDTGFTIVELLVVIGVLGIITVGLLATLDPIGQLQKGWDAQRKSDLSQVQKALETYYQDNNKYPASSSQYRIIKTGTTEAVWGFDWTPYITVLPKDPGKSGKTYVYYATSTGQSYYLYASLDRGGKDPQACNTSGDACSSISSNGISATACGGTCNYGVSSSNVSP